MKFQLKDVKSNPFRHAERYPILPEKVADLKESIETTGFWENIVGRRVGDKLEIAYGHHRLAALREVYPGTQEFDWRVRDLSDGVMIQMMARENSETYTTDVNVLMESIRAAVEAYAEGKILAEEMPVPEDTRKDLIIHAPSFIAGEPERLPRSRPCPYTAVSLAKFLGLTRRQRDAERAVDRLVMALKALELIERKALKESEIRGMTISKLEEKVKKCVEELDREREAERRAAEDEKIQKAEKERAEAAAAAEKERKKAVAEKEEAEREAKAAEEEEKRKKEAARKAEKDAQKSEDSAKQRAAEKAKREADEAKAERKEAEKRQRKAAAEAKKAEKKERKEKEAAEKQRVKEKEDADRRAAKRAAAIQRGEEIEERRKRFIETAYEVVSAGRKSLAVARHPDKGGSHDSMTELNEVTQWLNKIVKENEDEL